MRVLLAGCVCVALLITCPVSSGAELPSRVKGIVRIEGLDFRCPSCRLRSDGNCQFRLDGKETLVACDRLLAILLENSVAAGESPSDASLLSFLLERSRSYQTARAAFRLLGSSVTGRKLVRENLQPMIIRYNPIVSELVNEGWADERTLEALWDLPKQPETLRLRLIAAARSVHLGSDSVFASLSVSRPSEDDLILREAASVFRLTGHEDAHLFETAVSAAEACRGEAEPNQCSPSAVFNLGAAAALYLQRVRLRYTAEDVDAGSPSIVPAAISLNDEPSVERTRMLLYAAIVVGILALLRIRLRSTPKQSQEREECHNNLDRFERQELRELRRFFELDPRADESQFVQQYRSRARELHPDTGVGDAESFSLLTKKYRRARDLLARVS